MNKTGNSSQYRELQDDELDAVSGGESWLRVSLKPLLVLVCRPTTLSTWWMHLRPARVSRAVPGHASVERATATGPRAPSPRQGQASGISGEAIRRPYSARQRQGHRNQGRSRQRTGSHAARSAAPTRAQDQIKHCRAQPKLSPKTAGCETGVIGPGAVPPAARRGPPIHRNPYLKDF
jgi:hypothetical protein